MNHLKKHNLDLNWECVHFREIIVSFLWQDGTINIIFLLKTEVRSIFKLSILFKSLFIICRPCYPSYSEKFSEVTANAFGGSEHANITYIKIFLIIRTLVLMV